MKTISIRLAALLLLPFALQAETRIQPGTLQVVSSSYAGGGEHAAAHFLIMVDVNYVKC